MVLQRVSVSLSLAMALVTKDGFELLERRDGTHVSLLDELRNDLSDIACAKECVVVGQGAVVITAYVLMFAAMLQYM